MRTEFSAVASVKVRMKENTRPAAPVIEVAASSVAASAISSKSMASEVISIVTAAASDPEPWIVKSLPPWIVKSLPPASAKVAI
ncbi:MAG: hypothetical protein UX45_C0044G0002 [Candidatus Uhrbacteria bacterium GW2011_GWF2_46_218]|uniref:Uncharacterized protein n=1 Tax=Candidatus Uhrbacteria bacterium GW2011_GWF2_46_218 TaxID=1619001 RepID=A0A0G1PCH1_9BACT|nr:MAG: hypothetical protein UX45_C0044G0002 [Candidatus Uhrbacteria bacterium GW2011_GWF2_46_218]